MTKRNEILEKLKTELDPERFKHSLRVERTAEALARKHQVSVQKASLAGLLHDYARKFSRKELLKQAKKHRQKIDPISKLEPKLLHAGLSALLAKRIFGITSSEILKAIRRHTVGTPAMTKLEKIIYLADHIEEGRKFSGIKKVRAWADKNLDRAVFESASNTLKYLLVNNLPVHPGTVATRNYYLTHQRRVNA